MRASLRWSDGKTKKQKKATPFFKPTLKIEDTHDVHSKTTMHSYNTRLQARRFTQMKQDAQFIHTALYRFEKAREMDARLVVGLEFFQYLSEHPLLLELPKFRTAVNRKIAYLRTVIRSECKNAMTVFESHHFHFMTEEERENDKKAVALLRNADLLEDALREVELHMLPYE